MHGTRMPPRTVFFLFFGGGMIDCRVVPLFKYENMLSNMEEFQQAPHPYASAIYAECKEGPVLITAGHVADFDNLCVGCEEASTPKKFFQTIDGTRIISPKVNGNFGKIDWGVLFLAPEIANFLKRKYVTYAEGDDKGGPYKICGYPNNLNTTSTKTTHFEFTPQVISDLNEASEEEYRKIGYNRETNIVLKKDDRSFNFPRGISGGPIFDKEGNLVAIFTDYKKFLIGTRVPKILLDLKNGSYTSKIIACENS